MIVVLSLSMVIRLAVPSSSSVKFSSLTPRASVIARSLVKLAVSSHMPFGGAPADGLLIVRRDGAGLGAHLAFAGLTQPLEIAKHPLARPLYGTLEAHRTGAGRHVFRPLPNDLLGKYGPRRRAVARDVGR